MNNTQKSTIDAVFENKRLQAEKSLQYIYSEIERIVVNQPIERLVHIVIQEESPRVNEYIKSLQREIKKESIEAMISLGLSEAKANIVWANVMLATELPKVSLCRREDLKVEKQPSVDFRNVEKRSRHELKRLAKIKKIGIAATAAGVTTGVVSCLVVPGLSGVVGAIKIASAVVVVAGTTSVAVTYKNAEELNRLVNQMPQVSANHNEIKIVIRKLCNHQCVENNRNIQKWINSIHEKIVIQCDVELKR